MRYNQSTTEEFIKKAKTLHGNKYNYSKVEYINNHTKVCIICPKHGEFWQTPNKHLLGRGCPECAKTKRAQKRTLTTEEFIKRAKVVHGDKYDYSKVEYINSTTKVCIICPIHGEFWIRPNDHLSGKQGCPKCKKIKIHDSLALTTEEFIKRAKVVHGDKYDYSKVEYINNHTKVCIICPKHGEFWQTPSNHLNGKGCYVCKSSKLELEIINFFNKNNIEYIYEANKSVLSFLKLQTVDFYLPRYNVAIECQGEQHFRPSTFGSKTKTKNFCLKQIIERDNRKLQLCKKNNVKLLYYSNLGIEYPYKVFEDKELLLKEIRGTNN